MEQDETSTTTDRGADRLDDLHPGLQRLLEREGNAIEVAKLLYHENYELRAKNRDLRHKIEQGTVLDESQHALWQAYQQFGHPDDIATQLQERKAYEREVLLRRFAEQLDVRYHVLARLIANMPVESDDDKVIIIHNDRRVPLEHYVQTELSEFLPVLRQGQSARQRPTISGTAADPVRSFIDRVNVAREQRSNPFRQS